MSEFQEIMKKVIFILLVVTFPLLTLSGCNTAEGFGRDLEGAGRSIQDTF